jgi:phage tail sheath gpL-like
MAISFNQIPANLRVPGVYVEVDNTRAQSGLAQLNTRILVFGQRLATGTVLAHVPTLVTSKAQAVQYFGQGSMLANMFATLFDNNPYTEKWAIAVDDNGAGVKAAGLIDFAGSAATESGTLNIYIGGELIQVAIAAGDDDNTIATATAAAINANLDLPVTATVLDDDDDNSVTVTYRHKGAVGNELNMRLNYRGALGGEATPAGVTVALTQLTSGATNPTLTSAIAAIPDEIYNYWLMPYVDATSLAAMEGELSSRWSPLQMLEGHCFTAASDTVSNLSTLGNSRNSQFMTILDTSNDSPTPCYLWAAAMAGQVAYAATNDPARPFGTLPLVGVKAPRPENRRTMSERNTLLYDGISTHKVTRSGEVQLERIITTYQLNASDMPDASYLEANTMFVVSYLRQDLRAELTQKFPRQKLADDGTRFGAGQAIITPKLVKAIIVARAGLWEEAGLIENIAQLKQDLIVERSQVDRTTINIMVPPDIINPLHIFATMLSFIV